MTAHSQLSPTEPRSRGPLPLVLLHGVGLDSTMWGPLGAELRKAGQNEIITLDLPGHGQKPPLREPQSLSSLADDVFRQLPEKCNLLGFSLGALIAQAIAVSHSERIGRLICASSVCQRTDDERAAVRARLETASDDMTASSAASIERWFPTGATAVPDETIEQVRSTLLRNDSESFLRSYRVFAFGDAEIAGDLNRIEAKTMAITGELDPGSTPDMSERLAKAVPDCRSVVIRGARHMLPVEKPQAMAKEIVEFLARA
ncbi:alpha/beta fold hydrolase [Brevibacterium marinum]|uniref:Pimeloyl-ACP methyl ester carboxylesterase n=1 Tax=Brevibacterium marinum TaxID=418643 RepID=A0A846S2T4_9MICO|nr:alpha/beta hydrolase [Brevibacterium marinum]NJC55167.1 pimeloyl-ACP methyl ester carboxylesterase [Brevibacterium marinum]